MAYGVADLSRVTRTRLIGEISTVLREDNVPAATRKAGLTLIGWLARRMPHDPVDAKGTR